MNRESDRMYRIRFHGRGGQGMKTASRILGMAFFLAGFEVQDAPRYGAERRGAPIFAYVRAARGAINERGVISRPDLVIIADETLVPIPSAEVLSGVTRQTVLLVNSPGTVASWRERLAGAGRVLVLPAAVETGDAFAIRFIGAACAGAAARLVGVIPRDALEQAIRRELAHLGSEIVAENLHRALEPYNLMEPYAGCVMPGGALLPGDSRNPEWVDLPFEDARMSAPAVFSPGTSEMVKTGLWRTLRPVIDHSACRRCWLCSTYCPEGAISINAEGYPEVDYDHCKGCLICMAQCPSHAVRIVPESEAPDRGKDA